MVYKELKKLVNYAMKNHNLDEDEAMAILTDELAAKEWLSKEGCQGECYEHNDSYSKYPYK